MRKLIVVTGGSKGIGRAIIQKFSKEFDIVTCGRNEKDLQALKSEFGVNGCQLYIFKADLSDKAGALEFVNQVKSLNRPIDILVNNTGTYVPGQIHNEPDGTLEKMINTNLYSAYHVTRGITPGMMERNQGHIFTICSVASIVAYVNGGAYCVSKFALLGMVKVLREEMKPHGVRVTAILPGATFTSSWAGTDLPADRLMKPEDVAEAIYGTYALSATTVVEEIILRPQLGDI